MNLILLGNTCSGKSTLAKFLEMAGYVYMPTGDITRQLIKAGAHNLPYIWSTIIGTIDVKVNHVLDHFYLHTMRQLKDMTGQWPVVIEVIDKRTKPTLNAHSELKAPDKIRRYDAQYAGIIDYLGQIKVTPVRVINMDTGFDISELINAGIVPFNLPPVISMEDIYGNTK